ncbi:MAG TPA: glycosyltransferase [Terriglobales bacterium]|nr:glycosyltransferase [Terriglobales bacterium]
MKICLVTAFPPSRRGLNEYGYHIARELQADSLLSVTVLADEIAPETAELPEFDVQRCWRFNDLWNAPRLLKAVRDIKPDVVWFNLLFSTFGKDPLPAFNGLATPALTRMTGVYTHVTLHHLMDNIDLSHAGVRAQRIYRAAGSIATRMLLAANSVSVLLPAYRRTLMEKYRGENVHFRSHGILSARPEYPNFELRGNPVHRILAFGKWGTYKRLEQLIDAFRIFSAQLPNVKLVIGGENHPTTPGYVESIAAQVGDNDRVEFTGYVPEEELQQLFASATVLVMPYSSATGSSGVAHLACQYGVPIICADIDDFRDMANDEGLAIEFYRRGKPEHLAEKIIELVQSPERQHEMAEANFYAALRMTMPQIIRRYLRSFDVHQRAKALEPISRFRRLPAWIPSRSAIFRAAAPRWSPWM